MKRLSYQDGDPGGSPIMKKIIAVSSLAVLALTMLIPIARQVNTALVNHPLQAQSFPPPPPPGGGH
jgi:hypothetical protein